MSDAERIKELERERDEWRKKAMARDAKKARVPLDEMTLADMEALATRLAAAVATLREARPFLGPPESRPEAPPAAVAEAPMPARPPAPPIDHPRAHGRPVLSPEEEGRKRALLRANRGEDVKETA